MCFQHLKTRFHCHSVFVVHTNLKYTRPNLYDDQFGYFGHLQMICQHQMMCDIMKTTSGSQIGVPNRGPKSGSPIGVIEVQIRVQNGGPKSGSQIGVLNRGPKSGSQIGVPNWGPKSGSQIRVPNPDTKSGSQIGVPNRGPNSGS
jgi:hypothetical protein